MALNKTIIVQARFSSQDVNHNDIVQDIQYPDAYLCIHKVDGTKNYLAIHLDAFVDSTKEKRLWRKIYYFIPSVAIGSDNFIAQAYRHLKTLPEFADGEDC